MKICDFHTHHFSGLRPELISGQHCGDEGYFSLEFHPWQLPEHFVLPDINTLEKQLTPFDALGEVGLDRLRGPSLEVQLEYLKIFLTLVRECRKPVIFHVVRAWGELFAILAGFPGLRWAVHGFRQSPELLDELWKRGGIVSFHPSIVSNERLMPMLRKPAGKFAFESDDDNNLDLENIVNMTMKHSGNPDLLNLANQTFMEFVSNEC